MNHIHRHTHLLVCNQHYRLADRYYSSQMSQPKEHMLAFYIFQFLSESFLGGVIKKKNKFMHFSDNYNLFQKMPFTALHLRCTHFRLGLITCNYGDTKNINTHYFLVVNFIIKYCENFLEDMICLGLRFSIDITANSI